MKKWEVTNTMLIHYASNKCRNLRFQFYLSTIASVCQSLLIPPFNIYHHLPLSSFSNKHEHWRIIFTYSSINLLMHKMYYFMYPCHHAPAIIKGWHKIIKHKTKKWVCLFFKYSTWIPQLETASALDFRFIASQDNLFKMYKGMNWKEQLNMFIANEWFSCWVSP